MSQFLLIGLHLVLIQLQPVSPDPKTLIISAADHARAEALIEQLGSELYRHRAEATMELRAMGRRALPSLEAARNDDNPEVRHRVNLILPTIRRADFDAKLSTFLADAEGKYEHQLPGWDQFQAITGKSQAGRKLFIELMNSPPNRVLVQAVALAPEELSQRILRRQAEIYRLMYPPKIPGQPSPKRYEPDLIDTMGLIFAETIADDDVTFNLSGVSILRGYSLLSRTNMRTAIAAKPYAEPVRKLILAWSDSQTTTVGIYQAMYIVERLDWPETRKYAIRVLNEKTLSSFQISKTAIILAEYGTYADAKHLQPYLDNETILRRASNNSKEIQIRDLALAMIILLSKRNISDFGIKNRNPSNPLNSTTDFYFESADDRAKAFAKWNRLEPDLAVKPKEK